MTNITIKISVHSLLAKEIFPPEPGYYLHNTHFSDGGDIIVIWQKTQQADMYSLLEKIIRKVMDENGLKGHESSVIPLVEELQRRCIFSSVYSVDGL